jgi:hypothetical protein
MEAAGYRVGTIRGVWEGDPQLQGFSCSHFACLLCSPSTSTGTMARPIKFFDMLAHQPEQAH